MSQLTDRMPMPVPRVLAWFGFSGVARATGPRRSATRRAEWSGVTDGRERLWLATAFPFRRASRPTEQASGLFYPW